MIVFSAIMPHPPVSIPGIGTEENFAMIEKTRQAFDELREKLEAADPDTIIIISPHAYMEPYGFIINSAPELVGDFSKFGLAGEKYHFKNNIEIVKKIRFACKAGEFSAFKHEGQLDHGALIPLLHLTKNYPPAGKPKVVHLSFSLMSYELHYRYGQIIQKVMDAVESQADGGGENRIAVIASGDLSHRLTASAPAGFSPHANEFDHSMVRFLGAGDIASIMGMEHSFVEDVAECGIRSIIILLGILHGKKLKFKMLNYEAPFGAGYLTGYFS